jgi:hypothetical protein
VTLKEKRDAVVSWYILADQIVDLEKQIDDLKGKRESFISKLAQAYGENPEGHTNTHFLDKVVWELGQEQLDRAAAARKNLTVIEKPDV